MMRRCALAIHLAAALTAAPPAAARELKVATWNLGWLTTRPAGDPALPDNVRPKSAEDLTLLAGYAARLDADVVALQGIDDVATARAVFPPATYTVFLARDDVLQHTGFAVRVGLPAKAGEDLSELDIYPDARLHLRAGADITVGTGPDAVRLLSVHLKSGCRDAALTADRPACATLLRQAAVLRGWVTARQSEGGAFALLGDFGRVMDGDDFAARLGELPLMRATAGHASPCWGRGPFTDHVLFGGPAAAWVSQDSLRVMVYREARLADAASWRDRLSPHCPVSVKLSLP